MCTKENKLLNEHWIDKVINENGNTTHQHPWGAAKAVLTGQHVAVNTYIDK
jgi:hypothetical protein